MKDYFTRKEQIVILVIVLIVGSIGGIRLISSNKFKSNEEPLEILNQDINIDTVDYIEEEIIIMVHISGQVYNPGLVELKSGSRVKDAVDLAGGLKKEADIDRINLAKKLEDEEKIYVPKKGEDIDVEISSSSDNLSSNSGGKVNINTCSKEQLVDLPGIGEVTATKIIDYRNSNQFKSIEDIMNVSGIGVKKFEGLKDFIIVK
ncbi:MAG: helix-hairpin-helix domain-containing protein [Tissierellaceae bacterium]|nr:helix-hairpin-helix domain-containing protein [Tissierellaceae bacterium]